MDFDFSPEEQAFQQELCAFITRELSEDVRRAHHDPDEQGGWSLEFTRRFRQKLGAAGYISMSWPAEHGGGGKGALYQVILGAELEYHRAPDLGSNNYVAPALIAYGTADQQRRFLPLLRRGEVSLFLGYSEPEAGSDLAGLQTRAVVAGDHVVITGQKVYSSGANMADYGWVAARTDPDALKHRGNSLCIVDMKDPGVHIAGQRTVSGWEHHSVYFDHVQVPRSMLVGELNHGWRLLMGAIDVERAAFAGPGLVDS